MTTATIAINILGNAQSLERALDSARGRLQSFGDSLTDIGKKMSLAFTVPIAGAGAVALDAAGTFEQAMNTIRVVTGATEADMQSLQAEALRLGAVTSFSAGDAAAAMVALGKAGFDATQTMGAIAGVLDLAAASGMGLDQAAALTAKTLKAFGLEASQSGEVANMLAAAATSSAADISDLALGMQMASAVANTFGQSASTTTAALAILNDNALRGSDAGTSLKTAMQRLYAPTDDAAAVLRQLGVSAYDMDGNARNLFDVLSDMRTAMYGVSEVTVMTGGRTQEQSDRFVQLGKRIEQVKTKLQDYQSGIAGIAQSENDKIVSIDRLNRELAALQAEYSTLAGIQGTATTVLKEYTEAERNAMLQTLGGSDAIRSLSILLGQTEEEVLAMVGAVDEQGKAAAMAGAKMDGFKGAIEYFKGSVESTLITAVLPFLDGIGALIRQAADLIAIFGTLPPEMQQTTIAILAVVAAIGPGLLAIGSFAKMAAWLAGPVLGALSAALAALTSPIVLTVAALAALGAVAWSMNLGGIQEKVSEIATAFGEWLSGADSVKENLASIWETFSQFMAGEISLGDLGETLQAEIAKMGETLKGLFTGDSFTKLQEDVIAALDLTGIAETVQLAFTSFDWSSMNLESLSNGLKLATAGAIEAIDWQGTGENVRGFFDGLSTNINSIDWSAAGTNVGEFFKGIVGGIASFLTGSTDADKTIGESLNAMLINVWGRAMGELDPEAIQESMAGFGETMIGAINSFWTGLAESIGVEGSPLDALTLASERFQEMAIGFRQTLIDSLANGIASIDWSEVAWNFITMIDSITVKIAETDWSAVGRGVVQAIASLFSGAGTNVSSVDWSRLTGAAKTAIESIDWGVIGGAFNGLGTAILNAIRDVISGVINELGSVTGIGNAVEGAQQVAGEIGQNLNNAVSGVQNWLTGGGNRLGTQFATGGLTLVGEGGPEIVNLPRGASVLNNRESFGGASLGGNVSVTVNATVSNDVDIERLAYRIQQELSRRG